MTRVYLQRMIAQVPDARLPRAWLDHEITTFSREKLLYDYQQQALRHALKALWKYYEEFCNYQPDEPEQANHRRKQKMMDWYRNNRLSEDLSIRPSVPLAKLLEEYYDKYIHARTGKIAYEAFINRMSFWMATGSGKTLVIVKLIELLGRLMRLGELPPCDILFLTHRDDLIQQLKHHVNEFNSSRDDSRIVLYELKEYSTTRRELRSLFRNNEIVVFYYRSDNLSDEQKDKIVDFRNYDNDGRWFVLLDEAHKGDLKDSKRQHIYSILSRNGFLFNFSATFTDPLDIATTVYNFNLSEYIRRGYGKHLLVLQQELRAFKDKEDYSPDEKRKLVLKALILLAYVRKAYEDKINSGAKKAYHRPLMLVLVNSVNTEDADMKLFFRELAQIARWGIVESIWNKAREELWAELGQGPTFIFEEEHVQINRDLWESLTSDDLLTYIFNADTHGDIEVLLHPSNEKEMAFKLKSTDQPFAVIKIGDISSWLKSEASHYEVVQRLVDESYFANLNKEGSSINILMGSRAFYEGWDSNRPNVICYINIGTGTDAQKFILQSVGRGVRIEPIKNKRKRLLHLYNSGEIEQGLLQQIGNAVQPLETLFIFGTNRSAMQTVLENLRKERTAEKWQTLDVFKVNPEAKKACLLIPVYKLASAPRGQQKLIAKFEIAQEDLDALRSFVQRADIRVLLALLDAEPQQVKALREEFSDNKLKQNSIFAVNERRYGDLRRLLRRVVDYLGVTPEEVSRIKTLEDEIRHFKYISVSLEDISELEQGAKRVKDCPTQVEEEFAHKGKRIAIKHIAQHYYLPVVLSKDSNADYIRHIIKTESEIDFINDLEKYLGQKDNNFQLFDWWFFSKLDESLDGVYIPYYNPTNNNISRYNPDFIFWFRRCNRYYVVFVDPKSAEYTDYEHKVDGYEEVFTVDGIPKKFLYKDLTVTVHLFLYTKKNGKISEGYRRFWVSEIKELIEKIDLHRD